MTAAWSLLRPILLSGRPARAKIGTLRGIAKGQKAHTHSQAAQHAADGSPGRRWGMRWRTTFAVVASISTIGLGVRLHRQSKPGEYESVDQAPLSHLTWSALARRYIVYTCCSSMKLMDWSPHIIDWTHSTSIPGVKRGMEWIMLHTFFAQFVGGEKAETCKELLVDLARHSIGSIFVYSAEQDVASATNKHSHSTSLSSANLSSSPSSSLDDHARFLFMDKVHEYMHSIRVAAECNKRLEVEAAAQQSPSPTSSSVASTPSRAGSVMIAVKLSGLLQDGHVLERASAALVPRESFSDPPTTLPPPRLTIARGASPALMIPTSVLDEDDVSALKALWETLRAFARCAQEHGNVKILMDAEYSWYQPAIDALFESCAQEFNRLPNEGRKNNVLRSVLPWPRSTAAEKDVGLRTKEPLIYNTYQAYLRRTPAYLAMSMERARVGKYSLGVKLVRGAYVEVENGLWQDTIVPTPPGMDDSAVEAQRSAAKGAWKSPVWPSKALTDECYNMCARLLVDRVAHNIFEPDADATQLGVVFAGHNWDSAMTVIEQMVKTRLAVADGTNSTSLPPTPPVQGTNDDPHVPFRNLALVPGVRGRIFLGQLYGMADDLTYAIQCAFDPLSGGDGPHVALKYIPYGDLALVMPYLTRRAQENKSVMGGGRAGRERSAILAEVWRRTRGALPS